VPVALETNIAREAANPHALEQGRQEAKHKQAEQQSYKPSCHDWNFRRVGWIEYALRAQRGTKLSLSNF
jgi:hypothetical protein